MDMITQNMTLTQDFGSVAAKTESGSSALSGDKGVFSQMLKDMQNANQQPGAAEEEGNDPLVQNAAAQAAAPWNMAVWNLTIPENVLSVQNVQSQGAVQQQNVQAVLSGERVSPSAEGSGQMAVQPENQAISAPFGQEMQGGAGQENAGDPMLKNESGTEQAAQMETAYEAAGIRSGAASVDKEYQTVSAGETTVGETGEVQKVNAGAEQQPGATAPVQGENAQMSAAQDIRQISAAGRETADVGQTTLHLNESRPAENIQRTADLIERAAASGVRELEVQLEPAHLGKITIKATYEGGSAAVLITCSSTTAMEMLSQHAADIGVILQERMGQPTQIVVDRQAEQQPQEYDGQSGQQSGRENEEKEERRRRDSSRVLEGDFLQQLRLGIM